MIVLAKPLKFKNLREFVEYQVNFSHRDKEENHKKYIWFLDRQKQLSIPKNNYLCYNCHGKGSITVSTGYYDSEQERCCICKELGYLDKSVYKTLWEIYEIREKNILEAFIKKKKMFESIKNRLSDKQFKFILQHGEWFRK